MGKKRQVKEETESSSTDSDGRSDGDGSCDNDDAGASQPRDTSSGNCEIGGVSLLIIRVCLMCAHSSNEENPIKRGPLTRWIGWPWSHGTADAPSGKQCKVCAMVWLLGGFKEKYAKLKYLYQDMAKSNTLTDEVVACGKRMIELFNTGKVKERVRGGIKNDVCGIMTQVRETTVEIVKRTGVHIKDRFRAVTLQRWKSKYPNSDPRAEGMLMKELDVHGKRQMCILVRRLPQGEFDVEVEETLETVLRETHDNGQLQLRHDQQKDKYDVLRGGHT